MSDKKMTREGFEACSDKETMHTPEISGSGQTGRCAKCKLMPIFDQREGFEHESYDGCMGRLGGDIINACCGHGDDDMAYIQYSDKRRLGGKEAITEQLRILNASR